MSNPLIDGWLAIWDKLTGRRYRYRPPEEFELMDWHTQYLVARIYHYEKFTYQDALELLTRGELYPQLHYRHFKKRKSDGGWREIVEPDPTLKYIQQRLIKFFLDKGQVHSSAIGYRSKKSVADHVWAHAGAQTIITADIQDFFPSTSHHRVRDWWRKQTESEQAVKLATLLTTYRGSLPQGAPTSPALSNVVNYEMDQHLARRARQADGTYTRYADDMIFSWQRRQRPPSDFKQGVMRTMHNFGYNLHPVKGWCEYRAEDEPQITGVVLRKDGKVTIPEHMRQKMLELEQEEQDSARLAGYRGFQKMVENRGR